MFPLTNTNKAKHTLKTNKQNKMNENKFCAPGDLGDFFVISNNSAKGGGEGQIRFGETFLR